MADNKTTLWYGPLGSAWWHSIYEALSVPRALDMLRHSHHYWPQRLRCAAAESRALGDEDVAEALELDALKTATEARWVAEIAPAWLMVPGGVA